MDEENVQPIETKKKRRKLTKVLTKFFFPPAGTPRRMRIMPYAILGVVTLFFFVTGTYTWDYTNSPTFCGTTCHTMPPEYAAYQVSPHARVDCVECHIGRGFFATRFTRKAGDLKHVFYTVFQNYEYPIYAGELRPARETCERCHYPAKFSDDSLRTVVSYQYDQANTRIVTYLAMRTGGGTAREGLGRGIHWHIENEVYFVATDDLQQNIPYIRVVNSDGTEEIYRALDSQLSDEDLAGMEEPRMDCITCHNRITHNILPPSDSVDLALDRHQIDQDIPYVKYLAVAVMEGQYSTMDGALNAIDYLEEYNAREFPEYYAEHADEVATAIEVLKNIYRNSNFIDQKIDWNTHPNNLGHQNWPGCFRCHDGQHVNEDGEAIRLECNLCHSIPEVVTASVIEPVLPLATGVEPTSHLSSHWLYLHRDSFDQTCQACHTVSNPGGTENTSFCSNSACHGQEWEFAGLNAPGLATMVALTAEQEREEREAALAGKGDLTFNEQIGLLFSQNCTSCHKPALLTGGLDLTTYNGAMFGGNNGPIITPGNADSSMLIQRQETRHFANFTQAELDLVIEWIKIGAPEY